jgi:hypothetical membrane protein
LLLGGVVGPILFGGTILVEGATRPGYDPGRQFISVLSLGDWGWVQAANFIICGVLLIGFGVGLSRDQGGQPGRLIPSLMRLTGLVLIVSGLFPADPQLGYPEWISSAAVANPTLHSRIHIVAGFVATSTLSLAMVVEAGRAARAGAPAHGAHALASLVVMLGCFLLGLAIEPPAAGLPWAGVVQRVGLVAGLQWLVTLAAGRLGFGLRATNAHRASKRRRNAGPGRRVGLFTPPGGAMAGPPGRSA